MAPISSSSLSIGTATNDPRAAERLPIGDRSGYCQHVIGDVDDLLGLHDAARAGCLGPGRTGLVRRSSANCGGALSKLRHGETPSPSIEQQ